MISRQARSFPRYSFMALTNNLFTPNLWSYDPAIAAQRPRDSNSLHSRKFSGGNINGGIHRSLFRRSVTEGLSLTSQWEVCERRRRCKGVVFVTRNSAVEELKEKESLVNGILVNGNSGKHQKKLVVAVDLDEVLGSFVSALNRFLADRYARNHSVSEYYVYEFAKIWKCSYDEAMVRVHEFFETHYFQAGIDPIPGAHQTLLNLTKFCDFVVVTSRQNAIRDHTVEWIEKHYPGMFQEVHFGNHFALDGKATSKSEICRSLGADILIDDNPRYAQECAEHGIKVLLFDYLNTYPWSKPGPTVLHPLVTKVHDWQEVESHIVSSRYS